MPFTTTPASSPTAVPGIWVHTTLDAFNVRPADGDPLAFLSPADAARLERVRQARLLIDGRHREYFLDEGRTQFDFPAVRAAGRLLPLYLTYNVLALISLKGADLLFGEEPLLRAPHRAQQEALDALAERCGLQRLLYACALDASAEGECFLEACTHAGDVYLRQVPADEVFPLGEVGPDGQYAAYACRRVRNAGTDDAPVLLLLEVTYLPGRIERRCYHVDAAGARVEVPLGAWGAGEETRGRGDTETRGADRSAVSSSHGPLVALSPVTYTGVPHNTITWIPNLLIRGRAVSD